MTNAIRNTYRLSYATGAEEPAAFIDQPEHVYWSRRVMQLEAQLRDIIGTQETDAAICTVVGHTSRANRAMNICLALETEIEFAKHAEITVCDDWMAEFCDYGDISELDETELSPCYDTL